MTNPFRQRDPLVIVLAIAVIVLVLIMAGCSDALEPRTSDGNEIEVIDCYETPGHVMCRETPAAQQNPLPSNNGA